MSTGEGPSGTSLYELLGVPESATRHEIHRAYLRLARREHPDTGGSDVRMQTLNRAWAVLGNERRRRAYDLARADRTVQPIQADRDGDDVVGVDDLAAVDQDDRPLTPPMRRLSLLAVAPVALFLVSVGVFVLGVVFEGRHLLAVAFGLFVVASALMVALPFVQMTRSRRS